jgi:hypothetical protein
MRRLLFVPVVAALAAAGSMLAVSPANAAPAAATCKPGVIIASSLSVSPRVVHAGQPMTLSQSINNCTAKRQSVTVRISTTSPKACGGSGSMSFALVLKPHFQNAMSSGAQAPSCLGRYSQGWVISQRGKVLSRASASYTVIK